MKPLLPVAWGMLVIVCHVAVNGFDLLADPLGWALVLYGVGRLPSSMPWRDPIQVFAAVATAVSALLWVPGIRDALVSDADWLDLVFELPEVVLGLVLCLSLARLARAHGDATAATWLNRGAVVTVAGTALPVLLLVSDDPAVVVVLVLLGLASFVFVVCLFFKYAGRGWAAPDAAAVDAPSG